ncbi:MAG: polyphosphate kinase 1 [Phycisphaerales bacterium]|nr:polyphosphate kinase 1 [Phycisphaerales bacterium]
MPSPDQQGHLDDTQARDAGQAAGKDSSVNDDYTRDPAHFIGRDLAWLAFNGRVVAEAEDAQVPVFDRLKFLAISGSNFDEFFMKRIALLRKRVATGFEKLTHDGMTVRQQLKACRQEVIQLQQRQAALWTADLLPALRAQGITVASWSDLNHEQRGRVDTWFHDMVFPILTPLAVDPGHPFPFISNLSMNLGVLLSDPDSEFQRFARVKIPDGLPGWIGVPEEGDVGAIDGPVPMTVIPVHDVVQHNLHEIFPGMKIQDTLLFRVTRAAGLEEDDEDIEDLMEFVQESLRHRRFAEAVRLETPLDPSAGIVSMLLEELELEAEAHYAHEGLLDYPSVSDITRVDAPDLSRVRWQPVPPPRLRDSERDIFSVIRNGDVFVSHPYESFDSSVERFIHAAAVDRNVLAIKQCLYRTDPDSSFIKSLIAAADSGKQVSCIVELRARFDEDRNLQLTRLLEKHGIHVAYGIMALKTHAKTSLVVRREGDRLQAYGHVGSGNYHSVTARQYSDVGLLTCRREITEDLIELFNYLTGRSRHSDYKSLLVAPLTMRKQFYDLIDREIAAARDGRPARIWAKMNQLEDKGIMCRLIQASRAGVKIELVVRGFCCLRPGITDVSENITVRSIIGRFLEHSRIFHFANGCGDPADGLWYFGSADWMKRNLDSRVEVVTPVVDEEAKRRLHRILDVNIQDRADSWEMRSDGTYRPFEVPDGAASGPAISGTFETLCLDAREAEARARASGEAAERPRPTGHPDAID